jgi:hypothetical protein
MLTARQREEVTQSIRYSIQHFSARIAKETVESKPKKLPPLRNVVVFANKPRAKKELINVAEKQKPLEPISPKESLYINGSTLDSPKFKKNHKLSPLKMRERKYSAPTLSVLSIYKSPTIPRSASFQTPTLTARKEGSKVHVPKLKIGPPIQLDESFVLSPTSGRDLDWF